MIPINIFFFLLRNPKSNHLTTTALLLLLPCLKSKLWNYSMNIRKPSFLPKRPSSFSLSSSVNYSPTFSTAAAKVAPGAEEEGNGDGESSQVVVEEGKERMWDKMLLEIMREIISRVESTEVTWPSRKDVVSCACASRKWRDITMGIVRPPCESGAKITFPSSLKQPGPRDPPLQCFIKRNKKTATFYLYLSLNQMSTDNGKFLLAAQRSRRGAHIEYVISLDPEDLSQGSNAYMGKLRSDLLGTNFTIYDSQPSFSGAIASSTRASCRFPSKQISPQVPAGNFVVGQVSYKFNIFKSRGPRRMKCMLQYPSSPSTKDSSEEVSPKSYTSQSNPSETGSVVLKNKAPRWHDHLQCWCLNFHRRVTVVSVKNFQLVAAADPSKPGGLGDEDTMLLQFGKVGDNIFTMDYRQPLSSFQAFAISLTSFGTKLACE